MRTIVAILFWWFMVDGLTTSSVTTQGPFADQAQCEWARSLIIPGTGHVRSRMVYPCWSDGRS